MELKSVLLEELSWKEIKAAMDHGYDTVIVCAASNEQHGPHLAENTDYIFGLELCRAVAKRLGNALVAPVIRPGLSGHHMRHPGSLTLRPETFRMLIEDYVDSYVRHGFKKIVLMASHGTNFNPLASFVPDLQERYPDSKIICGMSLKDYMDLYDAGDRMYDLEPGTCGGHACCFETSVILHFHPEYVDMSSACRGYMEGNTPEFAANLFKNGMMGVSPCGIIGDATGATPERGKAFFDMFCDRACECITEKLQ
ncbi:MAG: creatininase family protein [Lachnospiraceae bacterium]|nr:creatininase family protein [Lachnospiraceae bacterium]